jgi:hypothetical protein
MKYIITNDLDVIIFSDGISHDKMAAKFGGAKSAGYLTEDLKPYGQSVSLGGLKPGERDEEIIKSRF